MNRTTDKTSLVRFWRWGIIIAFLLVYFTIGDSGPFLFDNTFIGNTTYEWDWEWANRFESAYEWVLMAVLTGGLYLFLTYFRDKFPPRVTKRQLMLIIAAAGIVALLLSIELREHNAQRAVGDEFERQGGCILFSHHSTIFAGYWHERIVMAIGLLCSICGGMFRLSDITGFSRFEVPNSAR